MALDADARQKLQIVLLLGIVIAGGRAAYVVYERHEALKGDSKPKVDAPLKADYYVTPKKLYAYDLNSAKEITKQPVWVKLGYSNTYYPYNTASHKTDFAHEAGTLAPLEKLEITDVVTGLTPRAPDTKQIMAVFQRGGKTFAVPVGAEKDGDFKFYASDVFFIEDPRQLYQHWPAEVWKAIDEHRVEKGMSELQASFAVGMGVPQSSGDYGSRTLQYANGGKPVTVAFENDKAVEIREGAS
ncbi:MAG TPA: hypothetical protein VMT67_07560 [Terriglobales bacterium]|nr:hypothetical protein [Terriglobales bacterium]